MYGFALLAEDEPFILPSLGYSGLNEVALIKRRVLFDAMANMEDIIRRLLTEEFDKRNLATEASVKTVQTKVEAVDAKVTTVAGAVERLRVLVESRLH